MQYFSVCALAVKTKACMWNVYSFWAIYRLGLASRQCE